MGLNTRFIQKDTLKIALKIFADGMNMNSIKECALEALKTLNGN